MIDLVSFGIVIDDLVHADGTTILGLLGGGGPQTAWGMAAALGSGETVGIAGVVGRDCTPEVLMPLQRTGIDLSGLRHESSLTPRAWQRFDAAGSRSHLWRVPPKPGEEVYRTALDALPEHYRTARGMHWGLHPENPTLEHARRFTDAGVTVSLETFRPPEKPLTIEALHQLVSVCVIFSPTWGEAAAMVGSSDEGEVIRAFRDAGCQILALRRGEHGADIWDLRAGTFDGVHVPAVPTKVIDVTGAGNAFAGAFLARLNEDMVTASAHGAAAASFLLEQFGIPAGLPNSAEYKRRVDYAQQHGGVLTL